MQKCLHSFWFLFLMTLAFVAEGQDYLAYGSGRYSRINSILANPAGGHSSASRMDINLSAFELGFNNSLVLLHRSALGYPELPSTWQNKTPNVPDNVYKNFLIKGAQEPHALRLEQRRLLPSVSFRINSKNAIAFICSYRQFGNVEGISNQLSNLIQKEFDLSVLQNKPFENKNLMILKMNWLEYGFNYSRSFLLKKNHYLSAAVTFKLLQGLESAYFQGRQLAYLFSTKDTNSFLNADFSFARSREATAAIDFRGRFRQDLPHAAALQPGLDIGLVYEWKEQRTRAGKDTLLHKLKVGVALVDAGRMRFIKQQDYYDLNVYVTQTDVIRYLALGNSHEVDSVIRKDFPANTSSSQFTVLTPLALNLQSDYHIHSYYFLNLSAHLNAFNKTNFMRVQSTTAICLSPRYERYWLEIAVPLTYNVLSAQLGQYILPGFSLRAGPLRIGTNDVSALFRKSISGVHFYALLQLSIDKINRQQSRR
jgi:hypothetical protein